MDVRCASGCRLRVTRWLFGVVVHVGQDTRLVGRNAFFSPSQALAPPPERTKASPLVRSGDAHTSFLQQVKHEHDG